VHCTKAVLQLKLSQEQLERIQQALLPHCSLTAVTCFSMSVHGTALLHRELANPLPPWLSQEELLQFASPKRPSLPQVALTDTVQEGSTVTVAPATRPKKAPQPVEKPEATLRVDVKTPLANERTMLRWMRSAVMISSVSALLSSKRDDASQINGFLLGLAALLFLFWPLLVYRRRSLGFANLLHGEKVDRVLPQALGLTLVLALVATLAVHGLFADDIVVTNVTNLEP
jgi:hypothetical protein